MNAKAISYNMALEFKFFSTFVHLTSLSDHFKDLTFIDSFKNVRVVGLFFYSSTFTKRINVGQKVSLLTVENVQTLS